MKKYKAALTHDERHQLPDLITVGQAAARKLTHARLLLKADASPGGPAWLDQRIADAVEVGVATVGRVRQRFVEEGLDAALDRKPRPRPPRDRILDGRAEARLIALACSSPPKGRAEWALQLLAGRLIALEVVPAASDETVRRALKKTRSSRGRRSSGASRRKTTPSSSARWKTCSTCTTAPSTRSGRWSVWMKPASS